MRYFCGVLRLLYRALHCLGRDCRHRTGAVREIQAAQPPHLPAFFQPLYLDSVTSTNDEMKQRARAGAAEGSLIVAREQRAGRGRGGRQWTSKPGNLYMSLLLRPPGSVGAVAQISFLAAVALAEALLEVAPDLSPRLKWPNDVLIDGAKISGILLESSARSGGGVDWLVLGMGVNVAHHPEDAGQAATSLQAQGADNCTAFSLLATLAPALLRWLDIWRGAGFAPLRQAWLERAAGLGGPLRVRLPNEEFSGIFRDLDGDGNLRVEMPDGAMRSITAGEIFLP
ncbi:MAG: biotin--[acetyl-CoA-carboxylase] ligase [Alphaproteobacteria bacterium]|nr:biotin--[acetyl-CoA-carboxylase] ligase [Alphaproteobacteria bacterium]MBL6951391.1 biotin--[acetyl-CoA-carboxylase] ligase [Alphaproteobacteria bacterium]